MGRMWRRLFGNSWPKQKQDRAAWPQGCNCAGTELDANPNNGTGGGERAEAQKIVQDYQGLCHQFHSDGREQRMLLAESEQDFPVSPGHIQDLLDDRYTHEIMENLLTKVREGRPLNARQYLFYLRVLLVHITMANGQRAGPICNLTLQEAKEGLEKAKEMGQQVASLRCHKHKTHTQGPARLNIKGKLRKYVEVWIERVRSKKATHNNLVCLRNGSPVDSTTHSNHCDRLGKSIGQRIPHANLSRKMNGQASNKLGDKDKTDVAALMSHSQSTADKHYRRLGAEARMLQAFENLESARRRSQTSSSSRKAAQLEEEARPQSSQSVTIIETSDEEEQPLRQRQEPMEVDMDDGSTTAESDNIPYADSPSEDELLSDLDEDEQEEEDEEKEDAREDELFSDLEDEHEDEDEDKEDDREEEPAEKAPRASSQLALSTKFYPRVTVQRLVLSQPALKKKTRTRFSKEEEKEIVARHGLHKTKPPPLHVFKPVPPCCLMAARTPRDCRDKWRNMKK